MMIRFIVAIAIILMMSIPNAINPSTLKESIKDKHLESVITMIDTKLVQYYGKHNGNLPELLDADTLEAMGLSTRDFQDERGNTIFTYNKEAANSFVLTYTDSQNNIKASLNSGVFLGEIRINEY